MYDLDDSKGPRKKGGGGNAHDRAMGRARTDSNPSPLPPPTETPTPVIAVHPARKPAIERVFLAVENAIVLTVVGIVGGFMGFFVDGRCFLLLCIPLLLGIHRSPALEGIRLRAQLLIYGVVLLISGGMLWWCGIRVNESREHIPTVKEIGDYILAHAPWGDSTRAAQREGFVYVGPVMMGMTVDPDRNAAKYTWTFNVLLSNSKAPAYRVNVLFADEVVSDEMGPKATYSVEDQNKQRLTRTFDEIDVLDRNILQPPSFMWTPPHIEHEKYDATITWRGGSVTEWLAIEKRFDNWLYAMTVKDNESGAVLVDCKDKGFPYGPPKTTACFPEILRPVTLVHIPNPAN